MVDFQNDLGEVRTLRTAQALIIPANLGALTVTELINIVTTIPTKALSLGYQTQDGAWDLDISKDGDDIPLLQDDAVYPNGKVAGTMTFTAAQDSAALAYLRYNGQLPGTDGERSFDPTVATAGVIVVCIEYYSGNVVELTQVDFASIATKKLKPEPGQLKRVEVTLTKPRHHSEWSTNGGYTLEKTLQAVPAPAPEPDPEV